MSNPSKRRTRGVATSANASLLARDRAAQASLRSSLVSYDDPHIDSGLHWEPVSLPMDRRSHIPTQPSGLRVNSRASQSAQTRGGRPALVIAPPPRQKRLTGSKKALPASSWKGLLFAAPKNVQVCAQRHARKEVIHATGKAGKPTRRPKYGPYSKTRC